MSFDFTKPAAAPATDAVLSAIILGPSGAGKSSVCGTAGVKTLYLFTSGEDHGATNAAAMGGTLHPVCLDLEADVEATKAARKTDPEAPMVFRTLSADATYARLMQILTSIDDIKKAGFGAVAIDSATELETVIRCTKKWVDKCKTKDGGHNNFAEKDATLDMFRPIFMALKDLQRAAKIHTMITCILDVKTVGDDGEIEHAMPRLTGYAVAEGIIQMCHDVLVVGRMTKDGTSKHKFQFMVDVEKVSKDQQGRTKKAINFNPRITGLKVNELPKFVDADLTKIIKLKRKEK